MSDRAVTTPAGGSAEVRPGELVTVAPGVRRLTAPNPGLMTGPGTNTWLVGDDDHLALIDPGPDDDDHLAALLAAVGGGLRTILVTHTHVDHSPLARRLADATGATIGGWGDAPTPAPGGIDPNQVDFAADTHLVDGGTVDGPGWRLVAHHTPGHASNHLCFELAGRGLLFSGDHVMSGSTVVIAPPDGDMVRYLASLRRVQALAPRRIAPGHGSMIDDPATVLDDYLAHRLAREDQVRAGVDGSGADGTTAQALVESCYPGLAPALVPVARYSVWAHLRKLVTDGAVDGDPADIDGVWRPTT